MVERPAEGGVGRHGVAGLIATVPVLQRRHPVVVAGERQRHQLEVQLGDVLDHAVGPEGQAVAERGDGIDSQAVLRARRAHAGHGHLGVADRVEVLLQALPVGGAERGHGQKVGQLGAHQIIDALAAGDQLGGHGGLAATRRRQAHQLRIERVRVVVCGAHLPGPRALERDAFGDVAVAAISSVKCERIGACVVHRVCNHHVRGDASGIRCTATAACGSGGQ